MSFTDLADLVQVRPLDGWPGPRTPDGQRKPTPFDASWRSTVELLTREIRHLRVGNRHTILQLGITENQLRRDGLPRSDARIDDPGVILTVPSKHGDLTYPCDRFTGRTYRDNLQTWQHNLRAIALALEALRKVDRYGVTTSGQQYAGWKQLPAAGGTTTTDPWVVIAHHAGYSVEQAQEYGAAAVRRARKRAHPDTLGGTHRDFLAVQAAAEQLGIA